MKRLILWLTLAVIPLALVAGFSVERWDASPPMPEVSLGVMKSCAHLGALTKRIALDREHGVPLSKARYRYYQEYLTNRQTLFQSPAFALVLAYRSHALRPEVVKNLGVQTCIAAYYGFHDTTHQQALYQEALACQEDSRGEDEPLRALDDCMGRKYRHLLAEWWQDADHRNPARTELLAASESADSAR